MACVKTWDFTLWTDEAKQEDIKKDIKNDCVHWAFQQEKGDESQRLHFQGRIQLRKKKRVGQLIDLFKALKGAHWTPTANVNKQRFDYAMKTDTRVAGPWTDVDEEAPFKTWEVELFEEKGPLPFQKTILGSCMAQKDKKTAEPRTINVLIDLKGHIGKGVLSSVARYQKAAQTLPPICDFKQLMGFAMDLPCHAYIIDFPRAMDKKELRSFYMAVEAIKDGWLWDVRNKGRSITMNRPCIWVFTNEVPNMKFLSKDRWALWTVNEAKELVPWVAEPEEEEPKRKKQKLT